MKNLSILAYCALFVAMPALSQSSVGGEFDYYMVNGFDSDNPVSFQDDWYKGEVDFKVSAGDFSQVRIEVEEDGSWNDRGHSYAEGTPSINYFRVITDWGKFFGLESIGIRTDIGLYSYQTFDRVHFTGFGYEYSENYMNPYLRKDFGFKLSLSFADGLIQPYYAMSFDTVKSDNNPAGYEFLTGVGLDFDEIGVPLWLEGYFWNQTAAEKNAFGIEAMYTLDIGDFRFNTGGFLISREEDDIDGSGQQWGFGIAFRAFDAQICVSGTGAFGDDYWETKKRKPDSCSALSAMGIEASYDLFDWLTVISGCGLAFGDYKENAAGDRTFQTFEAGVIVKPDRGVKYKLGYIYADKDAVGANGKMSGYFTRTLNTRKLAGEKGGLYFTIQIDY
ncbi:MAG: hypothetical protein IKO95_03325 [Spirochaetia bacterium]|nr:hypothetical protein [Spirochaetia bacterium]